MYYQSFGEMIANIVSNKKLNGTIYWRKETNIFTIFITQFYFQEPKYNKLYTLSYYQNYIQIRTNNHN